MKLTVTCEECLYRMVIERRFTQPEDFKMVCCRCEAILTVRVTAHLLASQRVKV